MKIMSMFVCLCFLCASCAPAKFTPVTPIEIKFDKTEAYEVQSQLAKLPKPSKLIPMYVKMNGQTIKELPTAEGATHILLVPKEYGKIGGLLKLTKSYKAVAIEQEYLINTYISEINALKELVSLERQKTLMYRELWVDSENRYRQEKSQHNIDNAINKTGLVIVTIGAIVALALAL